MTVSAAAPVDGASPAPAPTDPARPAEGATTAARTGWLSTAGHRLGRLDLRNTWQVAAGSVFVPLGVVIILLAWYGSAHTPYIQQQIPYLVSGSFIGLGLMIIGGLFYWAHWLYRIYDQADVHQYQQLQRDQALLELLERAIGAGPVAAASGSTVSGAAASGSAGRPAVNGSSGPEAKLVVTATGSNVHRSDCPIVARHPAGARSIPAAEAAGRPACRICQPVVSG